MAWHTLTSLISIEQLLRSAQRTHGVTRTRETDYHKLRGVDRYGSLLYPHYSQKDLDLKSCFWKIVSRINLGPKEITGKERIFINGGSGSIGTVSIQLLKLCGYHVTATCSSQHVQRMKDMECDRVIDYKNEDFAKILAKDIDVFLDCVGDENSEAGALLVLREGGHYLTLRGNLLSTTDELGLAKGLSTVLSELVQKKASLKASRNISYDWVFNQPSHTALAIGAYLTEQGILKPPRLDGSVYRGLSSQTFIEAHQRQESGEASGKVVVEY